MNIRVSRLVPYATQGNHETRWDERVGELFNLYMGKSQYSFNCGGIHFIALDPTQLLQEPGYFSQKQLEWLENDLKETGKADSNCDLPSLSNWRSSLFYYESRQAFRSSRIV